MEHKVKKTRTVSNSNNIAQGSDSECLCRKTLGSPNFSVCRTIEFEAECRTVILRIEKSHYFSCVIDVFGKGRERTGITNLSECLSCSAVHETNIETITEGNTDSLADVIHTEKLSIRKIWIWIINRHIAATTQKKPVVVAKRIIDVETGDIPLGVDAPQGCVYRTRHINLHVGTLCNAQWRGHE